jgi:hypothetical protein
MTFLYILVYLICLISCYRKMCLERKPESHNLFFVVGSAIVQMVSRRLPTAAARVRGRVRSCGICGEQSGSGTGFLRVLRFLMPIRIPSIAPQSSSSSSIIQGWYNRPNSGRSTKWTQSHRIRKKKGFRVTNMFATDWTAGVLFPAREDRGFSPRHHF